MAFLKDQSWRVLKSWDTSGGQKTREPELSPVWWRRLTTVLTFTWRLSTRYCPSLSSELAEMIRKYYVHWETSVNVKQLIEKASPAFRPLHILLEKKAILLKRIASKKGYSARDYAPKVLLCSNYASVKIDIPGFKILKHDK